MLSSKRRVLWISVGLALVIGVAAGVFLPVFNRKERFTELDRNMLRLKTLATAIREFADDTDGHLPASLQVMVPKYITEERFAASLYRDPASRRTMDWLYYGSPSQLASATAIILASPSNQICPPHLMHHRIVGHSDTVVEVITDEDFQRKLTQIHADQP